MISMLNQHLPRAGTERQGHGRGGQIVPNEAASIVQRMEDLILIFLPSLSSASRSKVWDFFLGNQTAMAEKKDALHCDEVGVRKRAWRVLGRCLELEEEAGQKELDEVIVTSVVKIEETGGAKRVCPSYDGFMTGTDSRLSGPTFIPLTADTTHSSYITSPHTNSHTRGGPSDERARRTVSKGRFRCGHPNGGEDGGRRNCSTRTSG
jgi:hypothetical protein